MNFMVKMKPTQEVKVKDLMEKIKSSFNITVLSEITNGNDLGVVTVRKNQQFSDNHILFQFVFKEGELRIFQFVFSNIFTKFYETEMLDMIELAEKYGFEKVGEVINYTVYNSTLA